MFDSVGFKCGKTERAKRPRPFFAYRRKILFIPGCVQGAIIESVFYVRMYVCMYVGMYACMYVCTNVCMYVCM